MRRKYREAEHHVIQKHLGNETFATISLGLPAAVATMARSYGMDGDARKENAAKQIDYLDQTESSIAASFSSVKSKAFSVGGNDETAWSSIRDWTGGAVAPELEAQEVILVDR